MVFGWPSVLDLLLSAHKPKLEHTAAPFGLFHPVDIRLQWGLTPGLVSPQHEDDTDGMCTCEWGGAPVLSRNIRVTEQSSQSNRNFFSSSSSKERWTSQGPHRHLFYRKAAWLMMTWCDHSLFLGTPSIPCVSVWIMSPRFLPCPERGFIFQEFHIYSSLNPPPPSFISQSNFINWLEKRQNPQSQCWRHCPLIIPKCKLGGVEGWAVLFSCVPTQECWERLVAWATPSLSKDQRGYKCAMHGHQHQWPHKVWPSVGVNVHPGEQFDHSLWLLCFPFSYFLWLLKATTARAAIPTSPPCSVPLRYICWASPGQCQAGGRNHGDKVRDVPAQRCPARESELTPVANLHLRIDFF